MKKFSFRLQTVLEMREKALEDKRREMARVIAVLNEQNEVKERFIQKSDATRKSLESIYEGSKELDILEITNYKDFLGKMANEIVKQDAVIANTKNILKLKQHEVTNALKEVKILEKLKETQQKKFYEEMIYLEGKEIDDIASTRYKKAV